MSMYVCICVSFVWFTSRMSVTAFLMNLLYLFQWSQIVRNISVESGTRIFVSLPRTRKYSKFVLSIYSIPVGRNVEYTDKSAISCQRNRFSFAGPLWMNHPATSRYGVMATYFHTNNTQTPTQYTTSVQLPRNPPLFGQKVPISRKAVHMTPSWGF